MIRRIVIGAVPSVLIVFGLFWTLQGMIKVGAAPPQIRENIHLVDFVRLKKEQPLVKKERDKPRKPEVEKKPLKPKVDIRKELQVDKHPLLNERLDIDLPLNLCAKSALGDAYVSGFGDREISSSVIPVSRIDPIYPKRARILKQEGYVKMEFIITAFGTVRDVRVVDSRPENIFDEAAKRALLKWKFKPKVEENQKVEQVAMIQMDFKLTK